MDIFCIVLILFLVIFIIWLVPRIERLRDVSHYSATLHDAVEKELGILNARLIEIEERLKDPPEK